MSKTLSFITIGRVTRPHGIRGEVCAQYFAESLSYLEEGKAFLKTEKSVAKPLILTSWKEQGTLLVLKIKGVHSRTEAEFLRNFDIVIDESLLTYEDITYSTNIENKDSKFLDENGESILTSAISSKNIPSTDFSENSAEKFIDTHSSNSNTPCETNAIPLVKQEQTPFLHHIIGAKTYLSNTYVQNTLHSSFVSSKHIQNSHAPCQIDAENCPYLGIIEDIIFPAGQEIWVIKTDNDEEVLFPAVSEFLDKYDLSDLSNVKIYLTPPEGLLEIYL